MEEINLIEIEFDVQGMTGLGGEPKVLKALEGLPGVEKAFVSYPEKRAKVKCNSEVIEFGDIREALLKIGYVASIAGDRQNGKKINLSNPFKAKDFRSDDLVCFCFHYTRNDIEQDYISNGHSKIMAKIAAEKKAGMCECATKNPKGKGCLSDVRQVVDKLKGKKSEIILD